MTPLNLIEWSLSVLLAVIVLAVIVSTVRAVFATTTKDGPKPAASLNSEDKYWEKGKTGSHTYPRRGGYPSNTKVDSLPRLPEGPGPGYANPTPRVIFNSDFTPTPATSELIRRIQRATQTPPTTGEQGNKRNERNK